VSRGIKAFGPALFSRLHLGWLFLFFSAAPAFSLTPMEWFNSLVAGSDDPGFRDGPFYRAQFDHPAGLALDAAGGRLFVADANNHRIRVVYLNEQNRVETLAGTGQPLETDGPLEKASFGMPTALAWIPPDRLAVYDDGSRRLRMVDLGKKAVTTLGVDNKGQAVTVGALWSLVYRPQDDSLYFSLPAAHSIQKLDLKTQTFSTLLANEERLPAPKALCAVGNKLYAADQDGSAIYEVGLDTAAQQPPLAKVGKGRQVLALAESNGLLYALQAGDEPLAQVAPAYRPVSLATAWGLLLENQNPGAPPFFQLNAFQQAGLASSPLEPGKLFIAGHGVNQIVSVKDYHFDTTWGARSVTEMGVLSDFTYPEAKPPKTFRILVVGNSRAITAPVLVPGAGEKGSRVDAGAQGELSLRTNTFPKQLEFLLNEKASLEGVDRHFEVLTLAHPGQPTHFFAYYEVPVIARKYDADLVFILVSPLKEQDYAEYFLRPLTPEGIPSPTIDPEFLLKPFSKRIPDGAPRRFFEHCRQQGLIQVQDSGAVGFPFFDGLLRAADRETRDGLIELTGRPLGLLARKMEGTKNAGGAAVKFFLCYTPAFDNGSAPLADYESFWVDLCAREKIDLLDLTDPYTALETSFYPASEACCHNHYTAYGNYLIATLLSYYLPEKKWIPFEPAQNRGERTP